MTRSDYISYCSVCLNGQMTIEDGVICSLTNKIADFDKSCPSFNLDSDKKNKKIREYQVEIEGNIQKRNTFLKTMVNDDPDLKYLIEKPIETKLNNITLDKEIIISEARIYSLVLSLGFMGITGITLYSFNFSFSNIIAIFISSVFFISGIFCIYSFIKKPVLFKLNKSGLTIGDNTEFIPWNRINYIHFYRKTNNGFTEELLIVKMHLGFGKEKIIPIHHAEINSTEIGILVYSYLKSFKIN